MSFYSALVLAANQGYRVPSTLEFQHLLLDLDLLSPKADADDFANLSSDLISAFMDHEALALNDRFFAGDTISLSTKIEIFSLDNEHPNYVGAGTCVRIHGNGYFYPWSAEEIRDRILLLPKLVRLRQAVQQRLGGRFVFPNPRGVLSERHLLGNDGWIWFASES